MRSGGKVTLWDALSPEMRARVARLRDELQRRAQEIVKAQLSQPKAPWQVRAPAKVVPPVSGVRSTIVPRVYTQEPKPKQVTPSRRRAPVAVPRIEPFSFWELPPDASVREPAPTTIADRDRTEFEKVLSAGLTSTGSESGEDLFATIGLDFGTSATKVVVRFPYEPSEPAIAIPAPAHCRSMGHPYLWQTVLWIDDAGEFTAWPKRNANLLYSLKQGIIGRHADTVIVGGSAHRLSVTRTEAATAFLAFVVRHTRGWLSTNRPQLFRRRRPVWLLNVGLPAANIDDGPLMSAYRRAAAAAALLGNIQDQVTVEATRVFLSHPHVRAVGQSPVQAAELGVSVLPETAAEATGFAKSTSRAPGLYLMVDVGAMTLDVCTFRLVQNPSEDDQYSLFAADVKPLGVESYHWFLGLGKTESAFREQCGRSLREVVWGTKKDRDPNAECWRAGNDLPVFLAGGGAQNPPHRQIVESLDPWLREHAQNDGVRILELPVPESLDLPIAVPDFGRLAVAWGLSYPPTEIGKILPMSAIKNKAPPPIVDWSDRYTSKERV